ncbi:hypothetical protein [Lacisediminihabitans sp.]|jgi:hypothetical protein|uniref:hypothetical protein n=1 Tax=Lacisediminihabitans sp. TaxID=2787631 RepID=UPI002F92440F
MSTAQPITPQGPAAAVSTTDTRLFGILSLVLGIASIVVGHTVLVPVAAIVLGIIGLRREPASRAFSVWGIVLGSVMLALPVLIVAIGVAVLAPLAALAVFFG